MTDRTTDSTHTWQEVRVWPLRLAFVAAITLLVGCTTSETETARDRSPRFVDVSVGRGHMLALGEEGVVWSWGSNYNGELGRETRLYSAADIPAPVPLNDAITSVCAQGNTSFAISENGSLYGWGGSRYGELAGISHVRTSVGVTRPTKIDDVENVVSIACGSPLNVVLTADNALIHWGGHNPDESSSESFRTVPETLQTTSPIQDFDAGSTFAVVLMNGNVWGYGNNINGVFGAGEDRHPALEEVDTIDEPFIEIESGLDFVIGLTEDGVAYTWGGNEFKQRGDSVSDIYPSLVEGLSSITTTSSSSFFALALDSSGSVYSWGDNRSGQLGHDEARRDYGLPNKIDGLRGVRKVSAGNYTAAAIDSAGVVYTWGLNESIELGRPDNVGTVSPSNEPQPIVTNPDLYPEDVDFGL